MSQGPENAQTARILTLLSQVPRGTVATYGQIAAMAGNPRGARQVARLLHSSSDRHALPWHRIVNSRGGISLPEGGGYEEQRSRLEAEGVRFNENGSVPLSVYRWEGGTHLPPD